MKSQSSRTSAQQQAYAQIMASAASLAGTDAWTRLAQSLALSADPGATPPLVASLAAAFTTFPPAPDGDWPDVASLRIAVAEIVASSPWLNGEWQRTSNHSRAGGRHSGNVADRPLLTSLVAHRLPSSEQVTVDGLRLLLVAALLHEDPPASAVRLVADALRKATAMEAWRQVMRGIPAPEQPLACLRTWLSIVATYLDTAAPPQALANVPAHSIRAFHTSLRQLLALVVDVLHMQTRARAQTTLFADEAVKPAGVLRSVPHGRSPRATRSGGDGSRHHEAQFAERQGPIQEVLTFEEESADASLEPASVVLVIEDAQAPHEQAASNSAAAVEYRHASYRLIEMRQRLPWCWDHLNPLDLSLIVAALRRDLSGSGPRWRGAVVAAVTLAMGRRVLDVPPLGLHAPRAGGDWINSAGTWHRRVLRPAKAWRGSASLNSALVPTLDVIEIDLPTVLQQAFMSVIEAAPEATTLGQALDLTGENVLAVLSAWLDPLRAANASARLTHGRIARTLGVELAAGAGNDLHIHALTGSAEDVAPIAGYYVALSVADLQAAYTLALGRIFENHVARPVPSTGHIGASVLSATALSDWIVVLRQTVLTARTLHEQHNSYCLYVLWHLMAATGHRPVNDPCESLALVDLTRGLMLIADKSAHAPDEARLIPLSPLSVTLLRAWLEHLRRLSRWLTAEQPALATRIETVLQPRGPRALPLFFLLGETGEVERISRGTLAASLPAVLADLPPNQFRRELATQAIAQGWPHELAQELMGHVDLGQPAFGPWSCRSPSELDTLKPLLGDVLARQGWTALDSPLAEGPSRRGRPLPRTRPAAVLLGATTRRQQVAQTLKRSLDRMERILRRWCRRRDWRTLAQRDVDGLYRDVLDGRAQPNTVAELSALHRIDRLLRWIKRRHDLPQLRLPASRLRVSAPVPFVMDDMAQAALWSDLGEAFIEVLRARARATERAASDRLLAEALVSLSLHSLVCDAALSRNLMQRRCWHIVEVPDVVNFLVVKEPATNGSSSVRRYPLHPLTLALLSRIDGDPSTEIATSAQAVRRSTQRLIATLQQRCVGGTAPPLASAEMALAWLCDISAAAARMRLPGHLTSYLDGSTAAVGLPEADWLRWMTGHPVRLSETECAPEVPHDPAPDRPSDPLLPCRTGMTAGEQRAAALALHREVRRAFTQVDFKAVEKREDSNRSTNRIEHLLPLLDVALQHHADAPEFARAVVQWLIELLKHGLHGSDLRAVSCERYYTALMRRVIDILHGVALREVNDDALTDAYTMLMEQVSPRGQAMVLGRLREFHAFLMREHGLPEVDWSDITPEGMERWHSPDAGLVLWEDYGHALQLLLQDPTADLRERWMQAFVLVLMYRFGLRAGEVIGLLSSDLISIDGLWIVLVRPSDLREIKTDAGIRQVPLIGPLDTVEEHVIQTWREHADEYIGLDRIGALISRLDKPRHLVDRERLMRRITEALRAATGSTTVRPHHLRHTYASRLVTLMSLAELPADPGMLTLAKRLLGPCEPGNAQERLLGTPGLSKRGLWAAALALGHASPSTGLRWYTHVHDWLLSLATRPVFAEHEVRLDVPTASYACGKKLPRSRHKVVVDGDWVRRQRPPGVVPLGKRAIGQRRAADLPPRQPRPPAPLDLLTVDRLLEVVHRRGRVDGTLAQRLMQPPELIATILEHDHTVREQAGYDVPQSGWVPTSATHAVSHTRAGTRQPAETERVRRLLRALSGQLSDSSWIEFSRRASRTWRERYRAHSTPLVVTNTDEALGVVQWCQQAGIEPQDLLLLRPPGQAAPEIPALVPVITLESAALAPARALYRNQGRTRLGVQLRENDHGPLTHMTQLHRTLHVVSVWLLTSGNA